MIYTEYKFKRATPVWARDYEKDMNRTLLFECVLPRENEIFLHITAQNDYQLFINDELVFAGPARAAHGFFRVDELDISKYLTKEQNKVCVLVCGYHCDNFYLVNQQAFLCAEFLANGSVFGETGSDFWHAYLYSSKVQRVERYAYQRPFCEVYDFRSTTPLSKSGSELALVKYDINTFITREVSYPKLPYEGKCAIIGGGYVIKSDSPSPFKAWWYDQISSSKYGFPRESMEAVTTEYLCGYELVSTPTRKEGSLCANEYITVEMRANLTGYIKTEIECKSDTTLLLSFDEVLTNGKVDYQRMECVNGILYFLAGGKKYTLITAEPYTFKYLNIISIGGEIDIKNFGIIRASFNDDEIIKTLNDKADAQIKRIYDAATETFKQNTYDIFMDCPSRERAGWLCDSFFTSRVEYLMSGKSRVEHSFLANFVMGGQYEKNPKGMLPMCYPADHTDGNFIPNWAMWYVLELQEYIHRSRDFDFAMSIKDRIYGLLEYFKGFENEDGLLSRLKGWIFVEWSECNNLGWDINYPTNMLYYKLKSTVSELYNDSALLNEAEKLRETIRLKSRLNLFFCDNAVYNESGVPCLSGKCTETCQYYAFFTGVATIDEDKELWETLVNDFGSERKQNNKWESIYFSNAFIGNYLRLELLMRAGLKDILEKDIRGYFDYMALKTGTLWENDTESASCNHGFASHVLIWLDYLGYIDNK